MYMRDVADRNGWNKATCIHTPMLSGLKGKQGGRMDSFDHKMSKSDPSNAIILHDSQNALRKKLRKAFLDVQDSDSPVFEIINHIILPKLGSIRVTPKPEFGEPSEWNDIDQLTNAVSNGDLHPFDLKMATADSLSQILDPLREHFDSNNQLMNQIMEITG